MATVDVTQEWRRKPDSCVYRGLLFTGFHMYCLQAAVRCAFDVYTAEQRAHAAAQLEELERALADMDERA